MSATQAIVNRWRGREQSDLFRAGMVARAQPRIGRPKRNKPARRRTFPAARGKVRRGRIFLSSLDNSVWPICALRREEKMSLWLAKRAPIESTSTGGAVVCFGCWLRFQELRAESRRHYAGGSRLLRSPLPAATESFRCRLASRRSCRQQGFNESAGDESANSV